MSLRCRLLVAVAAALAAAAALPASAFAHAALLHTSPSASAVLNGPPSRVALTYSEAVEPRFAIISVTDAGGHPMTTGPPQRSAANPDTIEVPLRRTPEGWYLVYWRVISADGHPVRGAFTFAVGPNPGPQPTFVIPSLSETAATPALVTARWVAWLATMVAAGLFVFRLLIARPAARAGPGASLDAVSTAFWIALAAALCAVPLYLLLATAQFALRSAFDLGGVVPLMRDSQFGRAMFDLELVLALFGGAAALALWLDRPARAVRGTGELLAGAGALGAAGALLAVPGLSGHAAQTSPAGLMLPIDWLHLAAGSIWLGGLVGLLVLWASAGRERRTPVLGTVVPRFSRVALVSVLLLIASGTVASIVHLPTLGSLWQTSYGKAILVKIALLVGALAVASINLRRTTPRLARAATAHDEGLGGAAAALLRRTVGTEVVVVTAAVLAAAVLTSLPPPSSALGKEGQAAARVGPGAVRTTVSRSGYTLHVTVTPNRAALPNAFAVRILRGGRPLTGASVIAHFDMLDMQMSTISYILPERAPGLYGRQAPALVMVGHWALTFEITPRGGRTVEVVVVDQAGG